MTMNRMMTKYDDAEQDDEELSVLTRRFDAAHLFAGGDCAVRRVCFAIPFIAL